MFLFFFQSGVRSQVTCSGVLKPSRVISHMVTILISMKVIKKEDWN